MIKVDRNDFSWKFVDNEEPLEKESFFSKSRINIDEYLIRHMSIAITNKCNLSCEYCYKSVKHDGFIQEIPFEVIRHYIDDFAELDINGNKVETIQLIGGEPTLHDNFLDICRYIINKGIGLRISTNGTNTKILQSIEMQDLCNRGNIEFRISLDESPERYDRSLRNSNSDIICKNIKFLLQHKNDISVKSVITKQNIDYLPDFLGYLYRMGVENFSYSSLYNLGNASSSDFYKENYISDLEIYKKLLSICKIHPEYSSMLQANVIFHMLTSIFIKNPPYFFTKFYAYTNYDGNIYSQDQLIFRKFKIGNIYDYNINDIVENLRNMKLKYELHKESCTHCFGYPYCTKGNYGELYLRDNSMISEFPSCKDLKELMIYIMENYEASLHFLKSVFKSKK